MKFAGFDLQRNMVSRSPFYAEASWGIYPPESLTRTYRGPLWSFGI